MKFFRALIANVKKYGIRKVLLASSTYFLREVFLVVDGFDRKYKTDTDGRVNVDEFELLEENNRMQATNYVPTVSRYFQSVMSTIPLNFHDYTFIDLGSGKGKSLLLASEYDFKQIIGVEFCKNTHTIAKENIKLFLSKTQKCKKIESVLADASKYELPNGKLFIYLFNPFGTDILSKILGNLRSVKNLGEVYVLYANPIHGDLFIEHGYALTRNFNLDYRWALFKSTPDILKL